MILSNRLNWEVNVFARKQSLVIQKSLFSQTFNYFSDFFLLLLLSWLQYNANWYCTYGKKICSSITAPSTTPLHSCSSWDQNTCVYQQNFVYICKNNTKRNRNCFMILQWDTTWLYRHCQKSILVWFTTPWSQSSKNVFVKGLYCNVPYVVGSARLYYHHNSVEKQGEQQEVTDFNSKDLCE